MFAQFAGGSGTVQDPYQIATRAQLEAIKDNLTANYKLVTDIELAGTDWTPIAGVFTGRLFGEGHKLTNLSISSSAENVGLFSVLGDDAFINGIKIDGGTISSTATGDAAVRIGSIAGYINGSNVSIVECGNSAAISTVSAKVNSDSYAAGGIVGYVDATNTTINACYNIGNINGGSRVGGILGSKAGSSQTNVTNCYSHATVSGTSSSTNDAIGGIVGSVADVAINIKNCYSAGNVIAKGSTRAIGGIAGGRNMSTKVTIENSVALIDTLQMASTSSSYFFRVQGYTAKATLSNNHANAAMAYLYSTNTVKTASKNTVNDQDGADVTLANAKTAAWYASNLSTWDFDSTWTITEGNLPFLKWEVDGPTATPPTSPTVEPNPFPTDTIPIIVREQRLTASYIGVDGPYILYYPQGVRVVSVDKEGYIVEKSYGYLPDNYTFTVFSHNKQDSFDVTLHPIVRPNWKCPAPDSLLVISDIHGKWAPLVSVLREQQVIDDHFNWTYGTNEMLIIGDIFDRGNDVTTAYWLIYKLQQQARDAGGEVYCNYGNHEEMVLRDDLRYTYGASSSELKYKDFAAAYFGNADKFGTQCYNANTELGRWLQSCNAIQIVGKDLFVHGGLNQEFYNRNYEISNVNTIMSADILKTTGRDAFLFGTSSSTGGPLWYRGMVPDYIAKGSYTENSATPRTLHLPLETLQSMLQRYDIERVIIGHTEHNDGDGPIAYFEYDYRVVDVNVQTQTAMDNKRGRGILILKTGETFVVYDQNAGKTNKEMELPGSGVIPTTLGDVNANQFRVYPNPTKETITLKNASGKTVRVFNNSGKKVFEKAVTSNDEMISISDWTSGIYVVKIYDDGNAVDTVKVVKE
ncbi:hypothetical protein FACS1894201_02040 [Bacteroidia bacterium]|nr:hypothetical protein FACS1894201_02040 [Bacteroidia bacterium]